MIQVMHGPSALVPAQQEAPTLEVRARFYHGLSDPSRLAILDALMDGARSAGEIAKAAGLTLSNASRHLGCLRECGLVESRQEWRHIYFCLAEGVADLLLDNIRFITQVGGSVAQCQRPEMAASRG